MKKLFLVTIVAFAMSSISNAQFFVGGGVGFDLTGGKTVIGSTTTDKPKTTSFDFSPVVGYVLSDNLEVGLELSLNTEKTKTFDTPETIGKTTGFGLSPFARYYAVKMDKFGIFAQGVLVYNLETSKLTVSSTTTKGPKTTTLGFGVLPGISYDLNDQISLLAHINGLNLGFTRETEKDDNGNKDIDNNFGFGVNLNGIVTTGAISIGAIVKF